MKYDRGDFLIFNPDEIENLNSLDEIDKLLNTECIIDGIGPYPEKIAVLDSIITDIEGRIPQPIKHRISETSVFCLISPSFTEAVATTSYEKLRETATAWADSESWKYTDVHSFDLAGFLVGLYALCRKALDERKQLYLLLSCDVD
jgi:hypothetical protein